MYCVLCVWALLFVTCWEIHVNDKFARLKTNWLLLHRHFAICSPLSLYYMQCMFVVCVMYVIERITQSSYPLVRVVLKELLWLCVFVRRFIDHISVMFGYEDEVLWDRENKYKPDAIEVCNALICLCTL